jgi:hypothetical protein
MTTPDRGAKPMRILVTAFVPSHFMQMVPTVWALRAAGHEVVVAGMADVVATATTAGLPAVEIGAGTGGFTAQVRPGRLGAVATPAPPPGQDGVLTARELAERRPWDKITHFWRSLVEGSALEYAAFGRRWGADLVLCELDFTGLVAAGLLGIPAVLHRWGADLLTPMIHERAREALSDTCAALGLAGGFPFPDLIVDPCPPRLQFPGLPGAVAVRYIPYNGTGRAPGWAHDDGARRRIFVSLGMLGSQSVEAGWRRSLIGGLVDAVPGDVEIVLPLGAAAGEELGALPPTVRLTDPVPLNLVLDGCELVVHHGGAGTSLTACAFAVPQLVLPQPHPAHVGCGERVAETGIGLALEPGAVTGDPAALGKAVDTLLREPGYREAAGAMAAELAALPSAHTLAVAFEELVARRVPTALTSTA